MGSGTVAELVSKWGFALDQTSLARVERGIGGLSRKIFSLKTALVGIAAGVLGSVFVKTAGNMEQWTIAFETMLGSADKAKNLMEDITQFARKTPFELTELVENSKKLLAYGVEETNIIDTLDTLGNIAAGVGKDKLPQLILALGQVRAATKLRGQEVRQFTEAGVPLYEQLSKVTGKPIKDMQTLISAGKVSYEQTYQALRQLSEPGGRFANLMAKQSKTLFGILSNIKDSFIIISGKIGGKLLPYIKAAAQALYDFLGKNEQNIIAGAVELIKVAVNVFRDFYWIGKQLAPTINGMIGQVGGLSNALKILAEVLLAPILIFDDIANYLQGNDSLFGRLMSVIKTELPIFIAKFVDFFDPVQGIFRSIGAQLNYIWKMIKRIIDLLKSPAAAFFQSMTKVWGINNVAMGKTGKGLSELFDPHEMLAAINTAGAGQANFLNWMNPNTSPVVAAGGAMVNGALGNVGLSMGDININISAGGNVAETGAAVGVAVKDSLDKVLRQAKRDLKNPVVR